MHNDSYNFLSCSLNHNLALLIEQLMNEPYNIKSHNLVIKSIKNAELTHQEQKPISFDLYIAWKVLSRSSALTSAASFKWSLDAIHRDTSHYFDCINYEEIKKMEISEREDISRVIQEFAKKGDAISQKYTQNAQPLLVKYLEDAHTSAYERYHWMINHRKTIHQIMTQICQEVASQNAIEINIDHEDSIFNCIHFNHLTYVADYHSLAPRGKNTSWLLDALAWGSDPIYKFFNIQTALLYLATIKMDQGAQLNTQEMPPSDIKKIAKSIHKLSRTTLRESHTELMIQANKPLNDHTVVLTEVYQEMVDLLEDLHHSSIPLTHKISVEEAQKLKASSQ
ncbi:hypothetical protein N9C31_03880 [Gammaproteobacteria bacterium]|nr:hypothetical protein [Gammaproteobacteria bacterium]